MDTIREKQEIVVASKLDPAEVCTLSRDGLNERMAWIQHEILPHARTTERLESGLAWELDATPGLVEKLDHLIALERECCGGIVFERMEGSIPGRLRLEVRGIDPDAPLLRSLYIQRQDNAGWARLAKAGGLGVSLSLLVCCVLPMLAAALVGSVAAPLVALDQPSVIGLGALAATAAAWRWLGRRSAGTASRSSRDGACGAGC